MDQIARKKGAEVIAVPTDVSRLEEVQRLKDAVYGRFGEVALLMNNAALGGGGGPFENQERWHRLVEVNLWGPINGVQCFARAMIAQSEQAFLSLSHSQASKGPTVQILEYQEMRQFFVKGENHEP